MKRMISWSVCLLLLLQGSAVPVYGEGEKPEETKEETKEEETKDTENETNEKETDKQDETKEEEETYQGSISGILNADGRQVFTAQQNINSGGSAQSIFAVKNGGSLMADEMKLQKSGDSTIENRKNDTGVNAMAAAVNPKSLLQITKSDMSSISANAAVIFAADGAMVYGKQLTLSSTGIGADGIRCAFGASVFGAELKVTANGNESAAIAMGKGGGQVSLADSELYTHGADSPLLLVNGLAEVREVSGTATGSAIASITEGSTVRMDHARFTSTWKNTANHSGTAHAIEISGTKGKEAKLQIEHSTIASLIDSGAVISVVNTPLSLVLSDSDFSYNTDAASLIRMAGEQAKVKISAHGETMQGTIETCEGASSDIYLMEGSVYAGSLQRDDAEAEEQKTKMNVSLDASSVWILNGDCTVDDLVLEEGAQITDEEDRLVTIIADGHRVVYGNSDYVLHVNGTFSREGDFTKADALEKFKIDRKAFEEAVKEKDADDPDPAPAPPEPEPPVSNGNLSALVAGTCVMILAVITMIIRKK